MRVTYGYHMGPLGGRRVRERRLEAAKEDGKRRFPNWTSIEATLQPEYPATGPIMVEVTIPDLTIPNNADLSDNPGNLAVEAQRLADKAMKENR